MNNEGYLIYFWCLQYSCEYSENFFALSMNSLKLLRRNISNISQKSQPIARFSCFFIRNSHLCREIGTRKSTNRFFYICSDWCSAFEKLFWDNVFFLRFLKLLTERNNCERKIITLFLNRIIVLHLYFLKNPPLYIINYTLLIRNPRFLLPRFRRDGYGSQWVVQRDGHCLQSDR